MGVLFDYEAALFPANHRQSVEKEVLLSFQTPEICLFKEILTIC